MNTLDLIALLSILKDNGVTYFKNKDIEIVLNEYKYTKPDVVEEIKKVKKVLDDDDLLYYSSVK
jgi:hypothetical protein